MYEKGNVSFFFEGAKNSYQIGVAKSIIDALSPYLDTKVHVQYKKMKPGNAGFNARLNPEFRDESYHDSISINPDYQPQEELPVFLLHELGHSFEEKLQELIGNEGLEALPVGLDDDYADFYADLIPCYILNPELLEKVKGIPRVRNTILVLQKMFGNNDFSDLRKKLNEAIAQLPKVENEDKIGSTKTPGDDQKQTKLFERLFEKIDAFIKKHA